MENEINKVKAEVFIQEAHDLYNLDDYDESFEHSLKSYKFAMRIKEYGIAIDSLMIHVKSALQLNNLSICKNLLDSIVHLAKKRYDSKDLPLVLIETVEYYEFLGYFEIAEQLAPEALLMARQEKNLEAQVDALRKMAELHESVGNINIALVFLKDANVLIKKLDEPIHHVSVLLDEARLYTTLGDFTKALDIIENAEQVLENNNHDELSIDCLMARGDVYCSVLDIDKAMECYEQALDLLDENDDCSVVMPKMINRAGTLLLQAKEYNLAFDWYNSAKNIICNNDYKNHFPFVNLGLGETLNKKGKYVEAIEELWKAIDKITPNWYPNREVFCRTLDQLGFAFKMLNQNEVASKFMSFSEKFRVNIGIGINASHHVQSILDETINEIIAFINNVRYDLERYFQRFDFQIDLETGEIQYKGEKRKKSLTNDQLNVLRLLKNNKGIAVKHLDIVKANNPEASDETEETKALSRYYIKVIRERTTPHFIQTITGIGYMIPN